MKEFEVHESTHHPWFHTKEQDIEKHHYLDRTHKPFHYDEHADHEYHE